MCQTPNNRASNNQLLLRIGTITKGGPRSTAVYKPESMKAHTQLQVRAVNTELLVWTVPPSGIRPTRLMTSKGPA